MKNETEWRPQQWHVGKLGGRDAFSDGRTMFIGKPPTHGQPTIVMAPKNPANTKSLFDAAPEWAMGNARLTPTEPSESHEALVPVVTGRRVYCMGFPCRGRAPMVYVPIERYEYAIDYFPNVRFFLGHGDAPRKRPVICKVSKNVVGIIMPVNYNPNGKA